MSQPLATSRIRLNLIDWASGVNNPNTLPEAGAVGSFYERQGDNTTLPTETYLRLNSGATGWIKQNTVNLEVFNIRDFGAVLDGVTDDVVAVQNTIAAANAAGGGIVYFPAGSCKLGHRTGGAFAVLDLNNVQNVTFMGDGAASKILVIMNAGATDLYTFYVHNGSSGLRWENLYMDGAGITNPDPGEQTHMLFFAVDVTDTLGGPHDITVEGCYFGSIQGDNIRGLGATPGGVDTFVTNIRIEDNAIISNACRSGIAVQRYTNHWIVNDNFLTGSDDQDLDMEPTGGVPPNNTPQHWIITGNQFDHSSKNVVGVTITGNGGAGPALRSVFAYNLMHNSTGLEMHDTSNWQVHANTMLYTAPLGGDVGFSFTDGAHSNELSANIIDRPNRTTQLFRMFTVVTGLSTRERCAIIGNVGRGFGDVGGGQAISLDDDMNDFIVEGNVIEMDDATAGVASAIRSNASTAPVDGIQISGNMAIFTNAVGLFAFGGGTSGAQTFGNLLIYGNYSRHTQAGVRLAITGGGSFVDWRGAIHNNAVDITGSIVAIVAFTSGVAIEGDAGPAARIIQSLVVPAAAVPSPIGSIDLNTGGVDGTVFNYKEAAASIVDTAGWAGQGSNDIVFATVSVDTATAARFLATGMGQVIATATEIQWPTSRPGAIRQMRMKCTAGTGGGTNTYTLRKNGANTTITFAVLNTANSGSDTAHNSTYVAGDLYSVQVTKSVIATTAQTLVTVTLDQSA